ncbi:hypothetical protein MTR67_048313 [Solanum verrucosum]|uniref:Uncharacterized protein n=1 Tax=Solanum verrucosum TaxID=315347 RepID=A0AAF0V183_SOLVR|nr:hypothetical protein MTR67_048313 [Solanum verrucosum]
MDTIEQKGTRQLKERRVPSPEGDNLVSEKNKQSVCRQTVPRCSVISPKVTEPEDVEGSVGIELSWVQLERVNPKPFSTHLARESEWTKAKVVLHCFLLVFERN